MSKGKIYLVATPIGNLEDITYRALRILNEVDLIAAEDTRQTIKLLNHFEISKPLISYHRHNEDNRSNVLINKVLEGENIAIVSDAGTPAISDPGEEIVKEAIEKEIDIVPIPGACALVNALIASGLDTKEFTFFGFLPKNKKLRKEKLEDILNSVKTSIIYEAPHRLISTLNEMNKYFEASRKIVIAKELTKIHEQFFRGPIDEIVSNIGEPKGEYIILIEGTKVKKENELNKLSLEKHYEFYENLGLQKKDIIKRIAKDRNVSKNEIYQKFI